MGVVSAIESGWKGVLRDRGCVVHQKMSIVSIVSLLVLLSSVVRGQFRNDQDPDYYRYRNNERNSQRGRPPQYSTPSSIRDYNSGDKYYGTDSRRGEARYDDGRPRNHDFARNHEYGSAYGQIRDPDRFGSVRYDSRGRPREDYDGRHYDSRTDEGRFGILDGWRSDLQGELRPGDEPGIQLPLADLFVTTDTGKVQGFYTYLYDKPGTRYNDRPANKPIDLQRHWGNVSTFLGIPYARPPVVEGRFKPPRRVQNWYSTWQALDYRPACPQNLKYIGTSNGIRNGIHEDCLYLNIFTPSISVNGKARGYPVMFYIHGGNFDHGASNQFPGHMLSAWGEVVVVTINYRLGALGFLSTGDYHSPGNYGLMDMAMALEWTYNNIRFFNGDRNSITVFGPGAGAAAGGLLAVLPKTRNMVKQVIAESGSPIAEWAATDDIYRVQNTSRVYGLQVGCSVEDSYKLLQCLIRRSYEELSYAPIVPDVGYFAWLPIVDVNLTVPGDDWYEDWDEADWHILPSLARPLYKKNLHHPQLRFLTGVNRDEAAKMVFEDSRLKKKNYDVTVTEDFFDERIKDWVKHYNYSLNPQGAYDAIKWMYTFHPDPKNTTHIREQYTNMLSDALYRAPVDDMVKLLVNTTNKRGVPTYYYVLNTTVEALKLPLWREVPHDINYYFISGAPFMDPDFYAENFRISRETWGEGDRNISQFMMKTLANFAKWGNPTQTQVPIMDPSPNWLPVLEGTLRYLSINNTFNTTMHFNYRQPYCSFWSVYIPQVVLEWLPTVPPPVNPWIEMSQPITAAFYGIMLVAVVLLVILCVCCGLWKSAKRQRNKALDDLQYYSTENIDLQDDYKVREYLDKMSVNDEETRTINTAVSNVTATTMLANDNVQYNNYKNSVSRPTTPAPSMANGGNDYQSQNGYRSSRPVTPATSRPPSTSRPITPVSYIHEPSVKNYQHEPSVKNFQHEPSVKNFQPITPTSQRHIMMQQPQETTRIVGTLPKKQVYGEPAGSVNGEQQQPELILKEPMNGSRVGTLTMKQPVTSEMQLPAVAMYPETNNTAHPFIFKEPQIPLQNNTGYPQKPKANQQVYTIEPQDAVYPEASIAQPFIPKEQHFPSSNTEPAEIPLKAQQYATLNRQYANQDPQYAAQEQQYATLNRQYANQDPQYAAQERQYATQEPQYSAQDRQYAPQEQQYTTQERQYVTLDRPESSAGSSNGIVITMRSKGNANNPGVTSMTEPLVSKDSRDTTVHPIRSLHPNNAVTTMAGGQILNTEL